jgi:hypothetical protein
MKHVTCPLCGYESSTIRSRATCPHCRTRFDSLIHGLPSSSVPTLSNYLVGIVLMAATAFVSFGACTDPRTPWLFVALFGFVGTVAVLALAGVVIEFVARNMMAIIRIRRDSCVIDHRHCR